MPDHVVTLDDLRAGISLSTDASHRLVLKRIPAFFLELSLGFAAGSAVFSPARWSDRRASVFVALRKIFVYALRNPDKKLMLVGHSDATESTKLSEARARNVYALLKGERDEWAELCNAHHQTVDVQSILQWASREHGFACDPGQLDGVPGDWTRTALERFRRRYNDEFSGTLAVRGTVGVADWRAFYDLYEVSLARFLCVPEGELASRRCKLAFCGEPVLAGGGSWPVSRVGVDGLKSATQRRVDAVFVDDESYKPLQAQQPPGSDLYGTHLRFRRSVIALPSDVMDVRCISNDGIPVPEAEYELTLADGTKRKGRLDRSGGSVEVDVAPGACSVSFPDPDDLRAKALAARLRAALSEPIVWRAVYSVLSESPETLEKVEAAYRKYFDTLGRAGMATDLLRASDNERHRVPISHLMACADVSTLMPRTVPQVVAWVAPKFYEDAQADRNGVGARENNFVDATGTGVA